MCGRYALISNISELQGRFGFVLDGPAPEPRYNIAPTQQVLAVVNDGRAAGRDDAVGAGSVVGQGHQDWQPYD